jgi:peptidoglycan/LPS O-acetylase OafA/YrhL
MASSPPSRTPAAAPPDNPATFPAIDLLRALAALLVLVYHVTVLGKWEGVPQHGVWLAFHRGWVGVDLFFVISGFVIAWSALNGYAAQGPAFRWPFAQRRFWRIVPLYYFTSLIFLFLVQPALLAIPADKLATHVLSHLFFVHNLAPGTFGSINGVAWSVGLEVQFYLLMLLITPWLARVNAYRGLLMAAVLALAYRYLTTRVLVPGLPDTDVHEQLVAATQLPGVIDQFACGMFLALALRRREGLAHRWLTVGWRNFGFWLVLAGVLLWASLKLHLTYTYWDRAAMIVFWRPLLTLGMAGLVAAAVTFPWASIRLLAPLRYVGEISYGIYLWHLPILHVLKTHVPEIQGYSLLGHVVVCTLVLSSFSWHAFEKPWVRRRHGAQAAPRPAPALSPSP